MIAQRLGTTVQTVSKWRRRYRARMVVSEWPDRDAALAFWRSPDYAALKALRAGTGEFEVRLVDGVEPVNEDSP